MKYFYYNLNHVSLALLCLGLVVMVYLASLWATYRFLPGLRFQPDSTTSGALYLAIIGLIFSLIFAMDISAVWHNYDRVSAAVDQEADNLNNLYRNLDAYPAAFRGPVRAQLELYVERLVTVQFPLLAQGRSEEDPLARQMITGIYRRIVGFRSADPGGSSIQRQMLELVAENRSLRLARVHGAQPYLDPPMWIGLALGTILVMVFSCLFNMPDQRQHRLMHACLGASIGVVLLLLLGYNTPFHGPGAISADPIRMLHEKMWPAR